MTVASFVASATGTAARAATATSIVTAKGAKAMNSHPELGVSLADLPPVVVPEIVEGRSFADYHGDKTTIGAGGLRLIQRSPAHYFYALNAPPAEPTEAQTLGSLIHCAVLEPDAVDDRYAVRPPMDRRTKEGKAAYADFLASLGARTEVSADQMQAAREVQMAIRAHPRAEFMRDGRSEVSVYWTDEVTGVRCRMRTDFVSDDFPVIVDLKSCADAREEAFMRSAWNYGYAITAAWYLDGWKAATGEKRDYIFAAWEKDAPHASQWYYADSLLVEAGRERYRRLLKTYADCRRTGAWPAYSEHLLPLVPPAWAINPEDR